MKVRVSRPLVRDHLRTVPERRNLGREAARAVAIHAIAGLHQLLRQSHVGIVRLAVHSQSEHPRQETHLRGRVKVEGCGRVRKGVEGCGRVWKVWSG